MQKSSAKRNPRSKSRKEDLNAESSPSPGLPEQVAYEIQSQVREVQTKQEVSLMLQPLLTGFAETSIHTTKLQLDVDALTERISALEIVFGNGRGKNFIWEDLISKIADERAARIAEDKALSAFLENCKGRMDTLMDEIKTAEARFMGFREEMGD